MKFTGAAEVEKPRLTSHGYLVADARFCTCLDITALS
jgi:hypothetical protein